MTHWDGLASTSSTGESQRICVLGATNRVQDIDQAILRRMPKKFPVSLPSAHQRRGIFKLILRDTKIDTGRDKDDNNGADASGNDENDTINSNSNSKSKSKNKKNKKSEKTSRRFNLDTLVRLSAGMSGSEIKEACRDAAMIPVRECIQRKRAAGKLIHGVGADEVRGLRTSDFFVGLGSSSTSSISGTGGGDVSLSLSLSEKEKEKGKSRRLRLRQEHQRSRKQNGNEIEKEKDNRKRIKDIGDNHDDNRHDDNRVSASSASASASSGDYETEEDNDEDDEDRDDDKDSIEEEFRDVRR